MLALDHLKKIILAIQPLQDNVWNEFASIWKPYEAKRKTLLTKAGETERYLYFVLDGVQRGFYAHDDGREATIVFTYAFSFSGIADSFLLQQPSRFFLETLTASSFLRTEYKQVNNLLQRYPDFQACMFKSLSFTFAGVLERQIELQCFSAEEKFRALLKRSPHVLNLIPHKYLASYLGIDATNFSKLLGTVRL
ncbi:cAMP-binding domain of CRP or a regulatory subunit of cAMP-dependent protein kinases [Parafilimonas terrae]|uniref:cAMP-binding domain of CRP or a regulatory subunit of cAMP-dependent protein kinases n=2 Tax=Parafilimonas terrae TaxID=1465490 RepID=A0A1I5Z7Q9_9BACT|nr:cAMP-binding domain of CRP or a regulatory subunit of cAMP-dependent protein kinases [Parafilimonas terrae]